MRIRLLVGFVLFAVIATALLVIPIGITLETHESSDTLRVLKRDVKGLSTLLTDALNHGDVRRAATLSNSYIRSTGHQVLVVDRNGILIASTAGKSGVQPLLKIARTVGSLDKSGTSANIAGEGSQYYVAVLLHRVIDTGSMEHVVLVVTSPVRAANIRVRNDWRDLALFGLFMIVVACLFGFFISGSLVRPLRRISRAVEAVGRGSLEVRASESEGPRELRALAQAFNATSARLIALLESQRAFVEDASHQLRTPLTSLQLHLENLQLSGELSGASNLKHVLTEMGRLRRMVDSLLELARNESKNPSLVRVDLHDLVLERVDVWKALAAELELEIVITAMPDLVVLAIDDVLEQVVDNLLANAFDATPAGGRIEIRAFQSENSVELHVVDNGPGLTPSELALALRRFWRSRDSKGDGSGLGLAIVDQLVQLSGGFVELHEASGGGLDAMIVLRSA
ncbi:MAG TPA: HAMP domain-containing sensor histidine kinase [Acidimicrobiales bacterium]|nr:HAMP domain-containing sensor histidine kinase [Acidimicrobiales bacterium]